MSDPGEDRPVVVLLEPATAAERLGVSASGLRRLAPIYEVVHGELPRKGSGAEDKRARLWPSEAVERLRDARRLVELERCKTILEALRALEHGVSVEEVEMEPASRQNVSDLAISEALGVLSTEIRALRQELQELKQGRELEAPRQKENLPPRGENHGLLVRLALWIEGVLGR